MEITSLVSQSFIIFLTRESPIMFNSIREPALHKGTGKVIFHAFTLCSFLGRMFHFLIAYCLKQYFLFVLSSVPDSCIVRKNKRPYLLSLQNFIRCYDTSVLSVLDRKVCLFSSYIKAIP